MTPSQLAVTVAIGMGVVFCALLGLSVYIGIFKRLTARLEARRIDRLAAAQSGSEQVGEGAVGAAAAQVDDEDALAAAVIAVTLHLEGALGGVSAETVVAIATAIELERRRRFSLAQRQGDTSWRIYGRTSAMGARQRGQDMRSAWSRPGAGR